MGEPAFAGRLKAARGERVVNQSIRVDPLIGKSVAGRYRIIRLIGEGGMGAVYELEHTRIQRKFALKALTPLLAKHPQALGRFQREAEVVAKLRHPHIVDIVDWAQLDDGSPCMIIEYLEGEDLAARLESTGPLPWDFLARVADETMAALTVAHRAGIVHRDLKPDNIFLSRDGAGGEHVKLLDFGISKIQDSSTFSTTNAAVLGTPAYMSPEQAYGQTEHIGPATDVWAMGALLYEMATGKQAFSANSVPAILHRVCNGYADPIHQHRPDAPGEFVDLVGRALSRDPSHRLTSIVELRDQLQLVLGSMLTGPILRAPTGSPPDEYFDDPTGFALATPIPGRAPRGSSVPVAPGWGRQTAVDGSNDFAFAPTAAAKTGPQKHQHALNLNVPAAHGAELRPSRRTLWVALAGAVIAAIAAVAAVFGGEQTDPRSAGSLAAAPPRAANAESVPDITPPAAEPESVTIRLSSAPNGARVYQGNQLLGTTPFDHTLERGAQPVTYRVSAPGYRDSALSIETEAIEAGERHVTLERLPSKRAKKPKRTKRRNKRPRKARRPVAAPARPAKTDKPRKSSILDW